MQGVGLGRRSIRRGHVPTTKTYTHRPRASVNKTTLRSQVFTAYLVRLDGYPLRQQQAYLRSNQRRMRESSPSCCGSLLVIW